MLMITIEFMEDVRNHIWMVTGSIKSLSIISNTSLFSKKCYNTLNTADITQILNQRDETQDVNYKCYAWLIAID